MGDPCARSRTPEADPQGSARQRPRSCDRETGGAACRGTRSPPRRDRPSSAAARRDPVRDGCPGQASDPAPLSTASLARRSAIGPLARRTPTSRAHGASQACRRDRRATPDPMRAAFAGADAPSGEQQVERAHAADGARQPLRGAVARQPALDRSAGSEAAPRARRLAGRTPAPARRPRRRASPRDRGDHRNASGRATAATQSCCASHVAAVVDPDAELPRRGPARPRRVTDSSKRDLLDRVAQRLRRRPGRCAGAVGSARRRRRTRRATGERAARRRAAAILVPDPRPVVTPPASWARRSFFSTLPIWFFGSASTKWTTSGFLKLARRWRQNSLSSASSTLRAGTRHDHRGDALAPLDVRQADHRDLFHGAVRIEHRLDLGRRDVLAAADDHVVLASGEEDVAVRVDPPHVARRQPAVLRRRC